MGEQQSQASFKDVKKSMGFDEMLDDSTKLMKKFGKAGEIGKFMKEQKGKKLNVTPQNGMCVCPTCGNQHPHGPGGEQPQPAAPAAPAPVMGSPTSGSKEDDENTASSVSNTLGKVHENINKLIKSKSFSGHFKVNYNLVQNKVNGELQKTQKEEMQANKDLDKTEGQITKMRRSSGSSFVTSMIFGGPLATLMFTVVGGLILIALVRVAWRSWKKKYMPETDKKKFTIFGIAIPGVNQIKAFLLGIYNFIRVGIPNSLDRFKGFFKRVYEALWGKNGCIRNVDMIWITIKKLVFAWIIGQTKKVVGGWLTKILLRVAKLIPGWGTAIAFIAELAPELYVFISTQLMLYWQNKNAEAVSEAE